MTNLRFKVSRAFVVKTLGHISHVSVQKSGSMTLVFRDHGRLSVVAKALTKAGVAFYDSFYSGGRYIGVPKTVEAFVRPGFNKRPEGR